ncbi:hypothetical protein HT031_002747 [Scenedesmus sp. PABB004]|nr:hypothetical protein HT031_002747 [Scenedesmus sp. PABB004]
MAVLAALQLAVAVLRHPAVAAVQALGTAILLVGWAGWGLAALRRGREAARLEAGGYAAALAAAEEADGAAAAPAEPALAPRAAADGAGARQRRARPPAKQQQGGQQAAVSIWRSRPPGSAAADAAWPPLAVVCPVKGCRPHGADNWASQLAAHYGGPRVFVFAVESPADPAVAALSALLAGCEPLAPAPGALPPLPGHVLAAWRQGPGRLVLLVSAGLASTCSQKIHNILAGIDAALPALAALAPGAGAGAGAGGCSSGGGSCSSNGAGSSASGGGDARAGGDGASGVGDGGGDGASGGMCGGGAGYPWDIVPPPGGAAERRGRGGAWGRLLAHAAAAWHLPLLIGFSLADSGGFVWGGAMLLRAHALAAPPRAGGPQRRQDAPSILEVWRDGGYSDDLLLAGLCADRGLRIGLPASAHFPQRLPPAFTWAQYWNYLTRQLVVLDTYASPAAAATHRALLAAHVAGSAALAGAAGAAALQLAAGAAGAAAGGGVAAAGAALTPAAWAFLGAAAAAQASLAALAAGVARLFRVLSPRAPPPAPPAWGLVWAGWLLGSAVLPAAALAVLSRPTITWGGITYLRRRGRVVCVTHPRGAQAAPGG